MKRPFSGPPSTRRTGAWFPKPEMPACTMVPLATATRTALPPHAPPIVAMSTPWSSDHALGGTATAGFWNGNTIVDPSAEVASPSDVSSPGPLSWTGSFPLQLAVTVRHAVANRTQYRDLLDMLLLSGNRG